MEFIVLHNECKKTIIATVPSEGKQIFPYSSKICTKENAFIMWIVSWKRADLGPDFCGLILDPISNGLINTTQVQSPLLCLGPLGY